jgi:glycosyltransferase involved in cell wall biosynthesis
MKLVIISHTEHFKKNDETIVGWGATIREIDHLTKIFDEVYHVAPLHNAAPASGSLAYESSHVRFIPIKLSGGNSLIAKLNVLTTGLHNIRIISQTLKQCDVFQFRAPTGMGIYVIPFLIFFTKKKGWFKYAGNWIQKSPPLGYAMQRFYLRFFTKRIVTINGHWPKQKSNQLTFENPCLTEQEREEGLIVAKNKNYAGKLNLIFVGRLEDAKGVKRILNVLKEKELDRRDRIGMVHLVGDGNSRKAYEQFVEENKLKNVIFHGFLPRKEINKLFAQSHLFLLPSASEGFPKVIAEAANYGCVPIVSDVSSIGQYIIDGITGFLVPNADEKILKNKILDCFGFNNKQLRDIGLRAYEMGKNFTYSYYNYRIVNEILK